MRLENFIAIINIKIVKKAIWYKMIRFQFILFYKVKKGKSSQDFC